jgi:hypothetical protein
VRGVPHKVNSIPPSSLREATLSHKGRGKKG